MLTDPIDSSIGSAGQCRLESPSPYSCCVGLRLTHFAIFRFNRTSNVGSLIFVIKGEFALRDPCYALSKRKIEK